MSPIGKRIALSLMTAGAVTALVGGASFALFTATANNDTNTFAAGTVSFSAPAAPLTCNVTNMAPGDTHTCTYDVTYSGSLNAWLGLNATESGSLFTVIKTGDTPATAAVTAAAAAGNTMCKAPTSPLTVPSVVGTPDTVCEIANGESVTFTTTVNLPLTAGNDYQNQTGTVTLDAVAVQHRNNTNTAGTGPTSWQ